MDADGTGHVVRQDGTSLSQRYVEVVRNDARDEAEAIMADRPTTLSAAFWAQRADDLPS